MALQLKTLTEKEWHQRKKDAGIESSGVFAKAEQKNNIGPAIAAYRKARDGAQRKFDAGHVMAYIKSMEKLHGAISKLIGSDGVQGNRDLEAPKAKVLKAELVALRDEVRKAHAEANANLKDFDKLAAKGDAKHMKNVWADFNLD